MSNILVNNKARKPANTPKYTTKRGNVFYINFRLPSGSFFRQSLGTDSLKEVQISMGRLTPLIPLVQSGALAVEEFQKHIEGFRKASKQDLDSYVLGWLQDGLGEAQRIPELGRWHNKMFPDEKLSPELSASDSAGYAAAHKGRLYSGNDQTFRMMQRSLKHKNIVLPDDDDYGHSAASKIEMSRALVYQAYEAFYKGDLVAYENLVRSMQNQVEPLAKAPINIKVPTDITAPANVADPVSSLEPAESDTSPKLSEAAEMFITEKGSHWNKAISSENRRSLEILLHVLGDVSVRVVTKQDIRKTLDVIAALPKRTIAPYRALSLEQCIDYDVPEEDLISSAQVYKHLKIYKSFFKVFLKDQKDILKVAPTEGIRYEVQENRGGNFTYPEMKRIVAYLEALEDADWRKAFFLTLCYTGARRGEITDLKVGQLRTDEHTGRKYLFVEGGKSEHAQRQIPVHKNIEPLLLKLAEGKKPTAKLFLKMPGYTPVTNAWLAIMEACNAPDFNEKGQKRRVHSIRHSFITNAVRYAKPALLQWVVGHALTDTLGITARYTHDPILADLLPVIDGLEWG